MLDRRRGGTVVAQLLEELPETIDVPELLVEKGRVLDNFYVSSRYPNGPQVRLLITTVRCKVRWQFNMPVRLLSSSVLKWPDAQTVDKAVRRWAEDIHQNRKDVLRIGYFGSYARGDWGVGSDLDLIIILKIRFTF